MSERFFAAKPIENDFAILEDAEAHHLANVMRAKKGDRVVVFDGSGYEFVARIETVSKNKVECVVEQRRAENRELSLSLSLAVALPKGERQKWMIEKAVELGVARVIPLVTERGVAQPVDSALARLRRSVNEASKQCGRNRLMEIAEPWTIGDLVTKPPTSALRLIAHPQGRSLRQICIADDNTLASEQIFAAIGPEGGFTDEEVRAVESAGWASIGFGPRILRVETAAIALAAFFSLWES